MEQRSAGVVAPPAWNELDESRRDSSRAHARDIATKLELIGCAIAPLTDADARDFKFTDDEVKYLGIHEHDRWVKERVAAGWTAGPKDTAGKTTPYLVPFDELPADIAEYDLLLVREIPNLLAAAGMRVVRVNPG
ncbi:hypothetical protein AB431_10205 [Mycobacterium sp. EPa45]|nr:hypothetical protein AB431_10205 [Mycobacterium sp. EPa45]